MSTEPDEQKQTRVDAASQAFRSERKRLWALAYRMTGSGAEADDLVQEAFLRLASVPNERFPDSPAAWLFRVTTHLALDALRRRRRRRYVGPWLPTPISSEGGADSESDREIAGASLAVAPAALAATPTDPVTRYELMESATIAFLLALEALSPRQRAALLLRDAFGRSAAETANLLGTSEGNVRVLHLRARRALADYDGARCVPTRATRERHRAALEQLLAALEADDLDAVVRLLAPDVQTLTDSGGEFTAVARPLVGADAVARLYLVAARHRREGGTRTRWLEVNGLPAVLIDVLHPVRRQAPRSLIHLELDAEGKIGAIHAVLTPRKLGHLASESADVDRARGAL